MGYYSDGATQQETFSPNNPVSRAEVATILSRMLRGEKYQGSEQWRYHSHLLALQKADYLPFNLDPMQLITRLEAYTLLSLLP